MTGRGRESRGPATSFWVSWGRSAATLEMCRGMLRRVLASPLRRSERALGRGSGFERHASVRVREC